MKGMAVLCNLRRQEGLQPRVVRVVVSDKPEQRLEHEVWIQSSENLATLDLRPLHGLTVALALDELPTNQVQRYLEAVAAVEPGLICVTWHEDESGEDQIRLWEPSKPAWREIEVRRAA